MRPVLWTRGRRSYIWGDAARVAIPRRRRVRRNAASVRTTPATRAMLMRDHGNSDDARCEDWNSYVKPLDIVTPSKSVAAASIVTTCLCPCDQVPVRTMNRCVSFAHERECSVIGVVCRFVSTEVRFIGLEKTISTHAWSVSHAANVTRGDTGGALLTRTSTKADAEFPLVSPPRTVNRWTPSATDADCHVHWYGGDEDVPTRP